MVHFFYSQSRKQRNAYRLYKMVSLQWRRFRVRRSTEFTILSRRMIYKRSCTYHFVTRRQQCIRYNNFQTIYLQILHAFSHKKFTHFKGIRTRFVSYHWKIVRYQSNKTLVTNRQKKRKKAQLLSNNARIAGTIAKFDHVARAGNIITNKRICNTIIYITYIIYRQCTYNKMCIYSP